MKLNKISLSSLTKAINDLVFIRDLLIKVNNKSPQTLEEYICKRYIEVKNVSNIAKELNESGYRLQGRKYIGKDISKIINSTSGAIGDVAKAIHKYNNTLQKGGRSFSSLFRDLSSIGDIG